MEALNAYCDLDPDYKTTRTWLKTPGRLVIEHTIWQSSETIDLFHEGGYMDSYLDMPMPMSTEDPKFNYQLPVDPLSEDAELLGGINAQNPEGSWQTRVVERAREAIARRLAA